MRAYLVAIFLYEGIFGVNLRNYFFFLQKGGKESMKYRINVPSSCYQKVHQKEMAFTLLGINIFRNPETLLSPFLDFYLAFVSYIFYIFCANIYI